jgi:diguanylate cyclase (GGDEF)-like protein
MSSIATASNLDAPLAEGHLSRIGTAQAALMQGGPRVVWFMVVVATVVTAHIVAVNIAGLDPALFAVAVAIAGLACLSITQSGIQSFPAVRAVSSDLTARMAELERAKADAEAALKATQSRLGQLMAERDTLTVQLTLDPLTGAQNRRGLDAAFASHGAGMVMALLDIDRFKAINDTLGHDVGDRVLRDFTARLRTSLNDSLPVYRVGGEEFVVLFPQAKMAEVAQMLATFRQDLQDYLVTRAEDGLTLSFSAGLALRGAASDSFADLFKQADERLYKAKVTGRAKTVYLDDMPSTALNLAA